MADTSKHNSERPRIYFVEFLRIFLILSVFLVHVGDWIDTGIKGQVLTFFHTKAWSLPFAVDCFFIIGGFFLCRRITKTMETTSVVTSIGRLWMRLMPGIIFCYVLLALAGAMEWWKFPFCFFPSAGCGFSPAIVGYSDWFMGVYFLVSCLYLSLFSISRRGAWLWICVIMILCWFVQVSGKPGKGASFGGMYLMALGSLRGLSGMALGMVSSYLCNLWNPRQSFALRVVATTFEIIGIVVLFNHMFCTPHARTEDIAVELVVGMLLISAAHSWGMLSYALNRLGCVVYVSRYTYSILLAQGALVQFFRFNHNFMLDSHLCSLIIFCAAIPLTLTEYHFVERWLVPKLKLYFQNAP